MSRVFTPVIRLRRTPTGFTPPLSQIQKGAGFTIPEVLIAIFIILVAMGGAFALIQRTVASSATVSNQLVASYLAQEGIEIVRNIRDTNFLGIHKVGGGSWTDGGLGGCSGGCEAQYDSSGLILSTGNFLNIQGNGLYGYGVGTRTPFKRTITIASIGPEQIEVSVEVFWDERGQTRRVKAATELYNWL